MREGLLVRLTDRSLDPGEALTFAADPGAGGTVLFSGTVRDHSTEGGVGGLSYEVWEDRAIVSLEAIGEELFARWPIRRAALLHRFGDLAVGDVSVLVCCSAAHRAEAFEAARHAIERIKGEVPIWKKEHLLAGESHWVAGS